jgi:hypothetical protein
MMDLLEDFLVRDPLVAPSKAFGMVTLPMTLEPKIIWDDGEMPRFEVFIEGRIIGRFDTITEALLKLRTEFTANIQATCCDDCHEAVFS